MIHNILMWFLVKVFRKRDIIIDNNLYLRRFFLTPRSWRWRIFLHRIYRSDPDRELHDHPWDFTTLILKGGYKELLPSLQNPYHWGPPYRSRMAPAGTILHNKAEHTHRVELLNPTWSLLLVGQARRMWGFHTPTGWQDWRTYLGLQGEPEQPEDTIRESK